jgi:hypothetical protein
VFRSIAALPTQGIAMMTPQETQSLQDFLSQLTQVRGVGKDAQAEQLIGAALAQQPDAAYLLVQRAMLQDQALGAARSQIAQLQTQLQEARQSAPAGSGGGFLDPANAWGNSAAANPDAARRLAPAPAPGYAMGGTPQASALQAAPVAAASPGFFGGGGGSFLGSMAATAAGVAGGAFLFQGIGNLMGHHGGSRGLMDQQGNAAAADNSTVNNYYGTGQETPRTHAAALDQPDAGSADPGYDQVGNNDDLGSGEDINSI